MADLDAAMRQTEQMAAEAEQVAIAQRACHERELDELRETMRSSEDVVDTSESDAWTQRVTDLETEFQAAHGAQVRVEIELQAARVALEEKTQLVDTIKEKTRDVLSKMKENASKKAEELQNEMARMIAAATADKTKCENEVATLKAEAQAHMKTHELVSVGLEEKMEQLAAERKRATTQVETHESEAAALNSKLQDLQKQLADTKEQAVQDDGQQEMVATLKTELEEATRTAASSNTQAQAQAEALEQLSASLEENRQHLQAESNSAATQRGMHQSDVASLKEQINALQEQFVETEEAATSDAQHEMAAVRTELDVMTQRMASSEDQAREQISVVLKEKIQFNEEHQRAATQSETFRSEVEDLNSKLDTVQGQMADEQAARDVAVDTLRTELEEMMRNLASCKDQADLSDMAEKSTSQELAAMRTEAFAVKESLVEAQRSVEDQDASRQRAADMEKQCLALKEQLGEAHDQVARSDAYSKDATHLQSELTETEQKLAGHEAQATAELSAMQEEMHSHQQTAAETARQSMVKFESELHTLDRAKAEVQRELQATQERASAALRKLKDDSTKEVVDARRDLKEAEEACTEAREQAGAQKEAHSELSRTMARDLAMLQEARDREAMRLKEELREAADHLLNAGEQKADHERELVTWRGEFRRMETSLTTERDAWEVNREEHQREMSELLTDSARRVEESEEAAKEVLAQEIGAHRDKYRAEVSTLQDKAKNVVSVVREQAEERCQKLKSEVDEMRSESFVLQTSVLKESELAKQLESCAGAHKSEAQEKLRRSDRQLEEVKAECQELLNTMTVQDSAVSKQKHLEDRMGSLQQLLQVARTDAQAAQEKSAVLLTELCEANTKLGERTIEAQSLDDENKKTREQFCRQEESAKGELEHLRLALETSEANARTAFAARELDVENARKRSQQVTPVGDDAGQREVERVKAELDRVKREHDMEVQELRALSTAHAAEVARLTDEAEVARTNSESCRQLVRALQQRLSSQEQDAEVELKRLRAELDRSHHDLEPVRPCIPSEAPRDVRSASIPAQVIGAPALLDVFDPLRDREEEETLVLRDRVAALEKQCSDLQCQLDTRPVVYQMPDIEEGEPLTSPDEPEQLQRRAPFDQKLRDTLAPVIKVLHLPSQMEDRVGALGGVLYFKAYRRADRALRLFTSRLLRLHYLLWAFYVHLFFLYLYVAFSMSSTSCPELPDVGLPP